MGVGAGGAGGGERRCSVPPKTTEIIRFIKIKTFASRPFLVVQLIWAKVIFYKL